MTTKQRKVCVLGYRSVGKSSLSIQFVDKQFVDSYDPTIENTFSTTLRLRGGRSYTVTIVDTAGQDEYFIMPPHYTLAVHGYVLVYDITSRKSFEVAGMIRNRLSEQTGQSNVPVILVGNKSDLHREREVPTEEGKQIAESWGALFLEASAKKNESVVEVFTSVLSEIERMSGSQPSKPGTCLLQ